MRNTTHTSPTRIKHITHARYKIQAKAPTRQELIRAEVEIINELHRMLQDPKLSLNERLRAADVLAYHINNLNKMLPQDAEPERFEEQTLGNYVSGVEPRIHRRFIREFKAWKRTLLYRK